MPSHLTEAVEQLVAALPAAAAPASLGVLGPPPGPDPSGSE